MSKLRIAVIVALVLVLIVLTIVFWGSIASALFVYLLIVIACEMLIQRFLNNRDGSDFDE